MRPKREEKIDSFLKYQAQKFRRSLSSFRSTKYVNACRLWFSALAANSALQRSQSFLVKAELLRTRVSYVYNDHSICHGSEESMVIGSNSITWKQVITGLFCQSTIAALSHINLIMSTSSSNYPINQLIVLFLSCMILLRTCLSVPLWTVDCVICSVSASNIMS